MGWWGDQIDRSIAGESPLPAVIERLGVGRIAEWAPGYVRKEWPLDPEMLNQAGVLYGGYLGVLADQVLTFSALTVLEDHESARTGDMQLWFFRPISSGPLTIEGRVVTRSKRSAHIDVLFTTPEDKLAAKASGSMAILSNDAVQAAAKAAS